MPKQNPHKRKDISPYGGSSSNSSSKSSVSQSTTTSSNSDYDSSWEDAEHFTANAVGICSFIPLYALLMITLYSEEWEKEARDKCCITSIIFSIITTIATVVMIAIGNVSPLIWSLFLIFDISYVEAVVLRYCTRDDWYETIKFWVGGISLLLLIAAIVLVSIFVR